MNSFPSAPTSGTKASYCGFAVYAVHARRNEEFGISMTEHLKAGCIPAVPDEGGSPEVVDPLSLPCHVNEDAARIPTRPPAFRQEQPVPCGERGRVFSFECYMDTRQMMPYGIPERQI